MLHTYTTRVLQYEKTSASNGDETEMVFSDISYGDYVTAGDEVALPNYLVQLPSHNDVIVDIYD